MSGAAGWLATALIPAVAALAVWADHAAGRLRAMHIFHALRDTDPRPRAYPGDDDDTGLTALIEATREQPPRTFAWGPGEGDRQ